MVDLHCHILPDTDDGPATMDESIAMAESAIADGITHVVATPHLSTSYIFDFARVRRFRDELQAKVGDRLQIATGCDFHLSPENLIALQKNRHHYCINQRDFLLVEFNEFSIPPAMDQTLHEIQLAGVQPVITHPERNGILRAKPERLKKWVQQGCYAQVTGGALTGNFGAGSQQDALRWIGEGLIHFVASDAHNTKHRPLRLQPAYDVVVDQFGQEKARALFHDNPLAAFEGRELPHVPEIELELKVPRRKRFFFF
jgi:protein-tyrosine phosphatase